MKLKELMELLFESSFIHLYDTKGNEITTCLYDIPQNDIGVYDCAMETIAKYGYNKVLKINPMDLGELGITIDYEEYEEN